MRKAMRVTVKKMQRIFVRSRSRDHTEENSSQPNISVERNGLSEIEHGLEVHEDKLDEEFGSVGAETMPHTDYPSSSSDEEDNSYIVNLPEDSWCHENMKDAEHGGTCNPTEDASGPLTLVKCQNAPRSETVEAKKQIAPYYKLPAQVSRVVARNTCGDLEYKCASLPIDLQIKISAIKETLLYRHPPFYDFCVISSDHDYEDALQFKDYVSMSFGLAGCTLYDGFISLGADLFESYALMMNQSSKVFFFVSETFTRSAFCRRLQNGAVFDVLMSKVKHEREKCVPVFPNGFCRAPLALSGIAGLNPTQREVTRRSLDNTYTPQIRQRRLIMDIENYEKRCIEFKKEVTKCIADYRHNLSCQSLISKNNPEVNENDQKVLQLDNLDSTDIKSQDQKLNITDDNEIETNPNNVTRGMKSKNEGCFNPDNTGSHGIKEDIPDPPRNGQEDQNPLENEETRKNSVTYVTGCGDVHIGPKIHVVINQMNSEDATSIEQFLKNSIFDPLNNTTNKDSDISD